MRALILVLAIGLGACQPARLANLPAEVDAYLQALSAVEKADSPVSLEPLLAAAGAAQDKLMEIQPGSDQAWQETLSDKDYQTLRQQLRGLQLSRGQDVYAQPDGAFLNRLAQAHGRPEDQAFFALYASLWTEEMLPKYLNLGTGQAPCVRFGDGIVSALYREWWAYWTANAPHYADFTMQVLRDLEEVVELGTCACGDVESVRKELRDFTGTFPHSPATPAAQLRLAELSREDVDHYVHCR
ncbi:MAG TPA: hypothetical protein VGE51_04615 [Fontimonas sp.]